MKLDATKFSYGLLLTEEQKSEFILALGSDPNFITRRFFLDTLGVSSLSEDEEENFTTSDWFFAKSLEERGVPALQAFRTAYWSSFNNLSEFPPREDLAETFFSENLPVTLITEGKYRGLTSLDLYLFISLLGNQTLALLLLRQSKGYVNSLLTKYQGIKEILPLIAKMTEELNEKELSMLVLLCSDTPKEHRKKFGFALPEEFLDYCVKLLKQIPSWSSYEEKLRSDFSYLRPLIDLFDKLFGDTPFWLNNPTKSVLLLSLIEEVYGLPNFLKAGDFFTRNKKYINFYYDKIFLAFLTTVEIFSLGGSLDVEVDWVVSFNPALSDDFINRNYKGI